MNTYHRLTEPYVTFLKPKLEAEQSVLGALLYTGGEMMPECAGLLEPDDFLDSANRKIYSEMYWYFEDGKNIDFVTMVHKLGDEYKVYLAQLQELCPSIELWREYAEIILNHAKRDRAIKAVAELQNALLAEDDIPHCQELSVLACEKLNTTKQNGTMTAEEGYRRFVESFDVIPNYIKTGFGIMDDYLNIGEGKFVVVAARPTMGKTAFTLQIMPYIAKQKKTVYFSLETGNGTLYARLAATQLGIPVIDYLRRKNLDKQKALDAIRRIGKQNFITQEAAGWTVQQIKAKAIQLQAEVIFIDYGQIIKGEGNGRTEINTNISIALHTLAQQTGITVFVLLQINREGNDEPQLKHLKESGQYEQDADIALLIHAPDINEKPNERTITIAKNKEGPQGKFKFLWDGPTQRFSFYDNRYSGV